MSGDEIGWIGWGVLAIIGSILFVSAIIEETKSWLAQRWKRVYVQGNGGHAKVVKDMLWQADLPLNAHKRAVIAVGDNKARRIEATRLERKYQFVSIFHPKSYVSNLAEVGDGTVVMAGAVIQAYAKIGRHVIVNTGATVDHDCIVGDFAHIAPGAHLCGNVHVGEGALVGVGVGVAPGGKIPAWTLVKARRLEFASLS